MRVGNSAAPVITAMRKKSFGIIHVQSPAGAALTGVAPRRFVAPARCAWPRRNPRQQARGRRRHALRAVPPGAIVVACRPAYPPADAASGSSNGPSDAWCEDAGDRRYNRPFRRSANEPGDRLWRADRLYDIIIEIDHNIRPRVAGFGSAVFIHIARAGFAPTAGCVALRPRDLRLLASRLGPKSRIVIHS